MDFKTIKKEITSVAAATKTNDVKTLKMLWDIASLNNATELKECRELLKENFSQQFSKQLNGALSIILTIKEDEKLTQEQLAVLTDTAMGFYKAYKILRAYKKGNLHADGTILVDTIDNEKQKEIKVKPEVKVGNQAIQALEMRNVTAVEIENLFTQVQDKLFKLVENNQLAKAYEALTAADDILNG